MFDVLGYIHHWCQILENKRKTILRLITSHTNNDDHEAHLVTQSLPLLLSRFLHLHLLLKIQTHTDTSTRDLTYGVTMIIHPFYTHQSTFTFRLSCLSFINI